MPLSEPRARSAINSRTIHCQGFRREDGLWELEASLLDRRAYETSTPFRAPVPAGQPFHAMAVRIAFDSQRFIREIEVAIDAHPFRECPQAVPNFRRLLGVRFDAGFRKEVFARLGGEEGCTHVLNLLFDMAAVAVQTLGSQLRWDDRAMAERIYGLDAQGKPPVVGACKGYGR
ncbi:DUF2889 domain-containing protein, partial [uncultured Pseudacidovorax sp.]